MKLLTNRRYGGGRRNLDTRAVLEKGAVYSAEVAFSGVSAAEISRRIWVERRDFSAYEKLVSNQEVGTVMAKFYLRAESAAGVEAKGWTLKVPPHGGGEEEEWDIQGVVRKTRGSYAELTAELRQ